MDKTKKAYWQERLQQEEGFQLEESLEVLGAVPDGYIFSAPTRKLIAELQTVVDAGDLQNSRSALTATNVLIRQLQERITEDLASTTSRMDGSMSEQWLKEWLDQEPARWEMSGAETGKAFGLSASQVNRIKKKLLNGQKLDRRITPLCVARPIFIDQFACFHTRVN